MAFTLTELQALSDDVWMPTARDNWSKGNVMMYKLLKKVEKIGSCEKIRQVLEHSRSRGGAMGDTTKFDTARKEIFQAARFDWSYYWAGATITFNDEVKVSGGDAEIDMAMGKLDNMQRSIRDYMGDSIWMAYSDALSTYGSETYPFYGIPDLMLQTGATTYGGIAPNDMATWIAYQNANPLTMGFPTMQTLRRGCAVNNDAEGKPDLYVTTETLKDAFENTQQALKRHHDDELASAGFDNVSFGSRGAIVADDKATADSVNAFNFDLLYFKVHKDAFFAGPEWRRPTNEHIKTCQIEIACCFLTSERRAHGQLTLVTA